MLFRRVLVVLNVLVSLVVSVSAAEWTRFRGPNGDAKVNPGRERRARWWWGKRSM